MEFFPFFSGDGNSKLLIADQKRRLRLYKGTSLLSEHALLDVPTAIVTFIPDERAPAIPSLAIASGRHIFVYRKIFFLLIFLKKLGFFNKQTHATIFQILSANGAT